MAAVATLALSTSIAAQDNPLPAAVGFAEQTHDVVSSGDPADGNGTTGESVFKSPSGAICTSTGGGAANVQVSCEGNAPHNETSIAVDPANRNHMVASANDYQLRESSGGRVYETVFSRAEVTNDGGQTWTTYPIVFNAYTFTGDPAVAFDGHGNVYLATLGFDVSQGRSPTFVVPDVLVSRSSDGGVTWSSPVRVASGSGTVNSPGVFNDKEYITAWGDGNVLVTWTTFIDGQGGSYVSSPIHAAVSHNGGSSWAQGGVISGAAPWCTQSPHTAPTTPPSCDEDTGSVPVVAADGTIHVAFISQSDNTPGMMRDRYAEVQLDPATAQRIAGPFLVAQLIDGGSDYPVDAEGRQTYQDSQFRTWSLGNITADPTNASHLAVAWSDMRNSQLPAPADPYSAHTNSDVSVSQSMDGGQTWSAPTTLRSPGDQFMPWAAYDAAGMLRIGYFDRSYDSANHMFGYTLATEQSAGSLTFTTQQLSTALSDPTHGDRWFSGRTVNSSFPHPSSFIGDYSGIVALPGGGVGALWTDMRAHTCFTVRCGHSENAEYATAS